MSGFKQKMMFIFCVVAFGQVVRALVDEPSSCWKNRTFPCAVRATKAGESISWKLQVGAETTEVDLVAAKKTSLLFSQDGVKLLDGEIWVRSSRGLKLKVSNLEAKLQGEFWTQVDHKSAESRVEIRNLQAEVESISHGGKESFLPVGFENWYGEMNTAGALNIGVVRPIEREVFFKTWAKKLRVSKAVADEKIQEWKAIWKESAHASSELYSQVILRKIASEERQATIRQQKKEKAADERRQLQKLFRARNGFATE